MENTIVTLAASPISPSDNAPQAKSNAWIQIVAQYQQADVRRSVWQLVNTLVPYLFFAFLAYQALAFSFPLSLAFSAVAGFFGIRTFALFHDCGHGSFFPSTKVNDFFGVILGVITFTPYYAWRHSHAVHHARSGDLDRRGIGDVWTLTYDEYHALPFRKRLIYRLYRNPLTLFVVGPPVGFLVLNRIIQESGINPRERNSVVITNLAILAIALLASFTIGLKEYLLVQVPIVAFSTPFGSWLFYVQHQYENSYWERHKTWDYAQAALYGSSFYKLPKVMQWFTGNIGFHHIHHLSPRIPNYRLEQCHNDNPLFNSVPPLTLWQSLKSLRVRLYDEDRHRMIGLYRAPEELALPPG